MNKTAGTYRSDIAGPVAILGTGSMGGAILTGLVASGVKISGGVRITARSSARLSAWENYPGISAYPGSTHKNANSQAAQGARVVLIAVKPQQVPDMLIEISPKLEPGTTVISVAAGVKIAILEQLLPDSVSVLRAMPNTPVGVREGVTGLAAGSQTSEQDMGIAIELFSSVGSVLVVSEDRLDALSTISGSGPAYVFAFVEKLIDAARARGFSKPEAELLVQGTLQGAASLLAKTGDTPTHLREAVTSPGGSTQAALEVFEKANLGEIIDAATRAALTRTGELAPLG